MTREQILEDLSAWLDHLRREIVAIRAMSDAALFNTRYEIAEENFTTFADVLEHKLKTYGCSIPLRKDGG